MSAVMTTEAQSWSWMSSEATRSCIHATLTLSARLMRRGVGALPVVMSGLVVLININEQLSVEQPLPELESWQTLDLMAWFAATISASTVL